jgi:hypothetical protein
MHTDSSIINIFKISSFKILKYLTYYLVMNLSMLSFPNEARSQFQFRCVSHKPNSFHLIVE